jgi:putative phage-type endonuclease
MTNAPEQRTQEWHEARGKRVTASMVGAILGNSPYMDRNDAMRSLVRDAIGEPREFTGNIATEYGTANEATAMVDYRMETLHDVDAVGFIPFEDWAGCSPDGLIDEKGGLEIKCPYGLRDAPAPVPFKPLADQPQYNDQVQFSLFVTGREWWHFFQWTKNGCKMEVVKPDIDWQADAIPRLRQFHAEFLHELANNAEEYRQPKRVTVDTPEAYKMVEEWDGLNEQLDALAERKRDLLDSMAALAGKRDAFFAGRKLTLTERAGSVAYARVVKEHCKGLDLEPYRGKPSRYWGLR